MNHLYLLLLLLRLLIKLIRLLVLLLLLLMMNKLHRTVGRGGAVIVVYKADIHLILVQCNKLNKIKSKKYSTNYWVSKHFLVFFQMQVLDVFAYHF